MYMHACIHTYSYIYRTEKKLLQSALISELKYDQKFIEDKILYYLFYYL